MPRCPGGRVGRADETATGGGFSLQGLDQATRLEAKMELEDEGFWDWRGLGMIWRPEIYSSMYLSQVFPKPKCSGDAKYTTILDRIQMHPVKVTKLEDSVWTIAT